MWQRHLWGIGVVASRKQRLWLVAALALSAAHLSQQQPLAGQVALPELKSMAILISYQPLFSPQVALWGY